MEKVPVNRREFLKLAGLASAINTRILDLLKGMARRFKPAESQIVKQPDSQGSSSETGPDLENLDPNLLPFLEKSDHNRRLVADVQTCVAALTGFYDAFYGENAWDNQGSNIIEDVMNNQDLQKRIGDETHQKFRTLLRRARKNYRDRGQADLAEAIEHEISASVSENGGKITPVTAIRLAEYLLQDHQLSVPPDCIPPGAVLPADMVLMHSDINSHYGSQPDITGLLETVTAGDHLNIWHSRDSLDRDVTLSRVDRPREGQSPSWPEAKLLPASVVVSLAKETISDYQMYEHAFMILAKQRRKSETDNLVQETWYMILETTPDTTFGDTTDHSDRTGFKVGTLRLRAVRQPELLAEIFAKYKTAFTFRRSFEPVAERNIKNQSIPY